MIPRIVRRMYRRLFWRRQAAAYAAQWSETHGIGSPTGATQIRSDLEAFFESRLEGPGIWKWRHYFDIYERHFNPLRHREGLTVLEIGIYSGGSLDMWRDYFGPSATIYGVDIESACSRYERPGTHVLIGDQADPLFWRRMIADGKLPPPDIVVDDGGHTPTQQRVTLEELLPYIRPGGVYVCEDILGRDNAFASFVSGLVDSLNAFGGVISDPAHPNRRIVVPTNAIQSAIHSAHFYPYVAVIEKRKSHLPELVAPKHGSQWEPFLR